MRKNAKFRKGQTVYHEQFKTEVRLLRHHVGRMWVAEMMCPKTVVVHEELLRPPAREIGGKR